MTNEPVQPLVGRRMPLLEAARPVLDAMAQPVVVTDVDAMIVYWNDAAATMYGHSSAGALGRSVTTLLDVQADEATMRRMGDGIGQGRPWTGEIRVRTRSGAILTVVLSLTPLSDDERLVGFIGTSVDVTVATQDRHRLTQALALADRRSQELRHHALHDSLTDLPNRALILDRAEQMLTRGRRRKVATAALFVDLDHFKAINDTLGHAAGDQVLKEVAARLTGALRESDTVGRIGGDEFIVLVEGTSLDAGVALVADRLLAVLREPFIIDTGPGRLTTYHVTASIGIAEGDRPQAEDLLRDADLALYESKDAGRDYYTVFQTGMRTAVQDRLTLETDLRCALDEGQFFLEYQPTFNLYDTTTVGVEALLRWRHPTRGVLAPLEFLDTLEMTGMIVSVGRWIVNQVCRQGARWHDEGLPLTVSINVSDRQLHADSFITDVITALEDTGLSPAALVIEITESILMRDAAAILSKFAALKAAGVRIAIDDFGTSYSSLAYLRQFPIDVLKIDKSFIAAATGVGESDALLHTLVQLGKQLSLQTVAAGIETGDQLHRLQLQDCDTGQGFFIAKPMSALAVTEYIRSDNAFTAVAQGPSF